MYFLYNQGPRAILLSLSLLFFTSFTSFYTFFIKSGGFPWFSIDFSPKPMGSPEARRGVAGGSPETGPDESATAQMTPRGVAALVSCVTCT